MSGHSKWSKVKHQKATTDAVKSRAFTRASRAITVAVHEGGGVADPADNFRLRLAIEKAREVNMPKENIERAIKRAVESGAASYEQLMYEGYGPGGVAVIVDAATDNHQRTAAEVKHAFDRAGGTIATPGAVAYQFRRTGIVVIEKAGKMLDALLGDAVSAGADDVSELSDMFEVYAHADRVASVKEYLETCGWKADNWAIIMKPLTPASVSEEMRVRNDGLVTMLEEIDDVQNVYTNLE